MPNDCPRSDSVLSSGNMTVYSPPSAVIIPSREQRSPSGLSSTNFICLSSIFHAAHRRKDFNTIFILKNTNRCARDIVTI